MKHSLKIILLLLGMFFITQLIGLAVIYQYAPHMEQVIDAEGTLTNKTVYNLPYGTEPPEEVSPKDALISMVIAMALAVGLMLFLMRYRVVFFFRAWFFVVVTFALGVSINAFIQKIPYSSLIALVIAIPLAALRLFKRNIVVHNLTELLVYPGIAAIIVPILSVRTVALFLVVISLYDMYAVWHAGFMQKMAHYQIKTLKFFTGFFIPYLDKKERALLKKSSKMRQKKVKVNIAILGGGDVALPIIVAGVVLYQMGLVQALIVSLGATIALAWLFYISKKGKFYPAMPFISLGCFVALAIAFLL